MKHDVNNKDCCCINCVAAAKPHMTGTAPISMFWGVITPLDGNGFSYKFVPKDRKLNA